MKFAMVCSAVLAALATPAEAHWQYTQWGMSPEGAISASQGALKPGDKSKSVQTGDTREASGTYTAGDLTFEASLYFSAKGLATVALILRDDNKCRNLGRDLLAKYGSPVEPPRTGSSVQRTMWADRDGGNKVALLTTGLGSCQLTYEPLVSATGAGL